MLDKNNKIQTEEKAVLVGLIYKEQTEAHVNEYLTELAFLAETAGAVTLKNFIQKLPHPDSKTFVGKGKLEEIKEYAKAKGVSLVIFDDELSPAQGKNLEEEMGKRVIDRAELILDIFAVRARSAEARTASIALLRTSWSI